MRHAGPLQGPGDGVVELEAGRGDRLLEALGFASPTIGTLTGDSRSSQARATWAWGGAGRPSDCLVLRAAEPVAELACLGPALSCLPGPYQAAAASGL